ncbi:hypothetical protein PoB_006402400 [Plakobranchus ocellatus]|uniref:Uncharacterized protein n=1 Tax=Plakobranchus ocellatus TaxID=259542 RepID=A0AAV4D0C3_9GAST|nr:hypothetical protein PoB_006402400 [Plakobranchus ocellatus]
MANYLITPYAKNNQDSNPGSRKRGTHLTFILSEKQEEQEDQEKQEQEQQEEQEKQEEQEEQEEQKGPEH